ncbi:MAG: Ig-like domain-containing protein [Gemmataceae bacterium]
MLRLEQIETRLAPANATIGVIGDYGAVSGSTADVANLVKSWNPDSVITVGDNNYPHGAAATIDANIGQYYHTFIGNYSGAYGAGAAVNQFFPSLGNHDWETRSGTPALPTPYLNYFTLPGNERYYTFTRGPIQFFAIDSGDGTGTDSDSFDPDGYSSTSVQAQWLQSQLAASAAPWKLVYFHHSPYSSGDHGNDPIMQWPFQAWGATAVLTGHDHDYERLSVGGLPYFVNGLGGYSLDPLGPTAAGNQVRYDGDFGAMRIDASDTSIQFKFITRKGAVIDNYSINTPTITPTTLIAAGSAWKYLANGTNQGTAWRATTFNDSAWPSGNTEIGYGDGDEATVVGYGPDPNNKYITTYFRKSFTVTNASAVTALNMRLLRDDGAVVYINGVEVYRSNMPSGTISYNTGASSALGVPDESTFLEVSLSPSALASGTNVIAVEIHQDNGASSDIGFNLQLSATFSNPPTGVPSPSIPDLVAGSDSGSANNDNITRVVSPTFSGTALAGSTVKIYSDGVLVGSGIANAGTYSITTSALASGTHAITATATDTSGTVSSASNALNVIIDTTPPTADVVDVSPDPRTDSVSAISITVSEPIYGLVLANLKLSRDGGTNLLTASQTLTTIDNVNWKLNNLSGVTGAIGTYSLTLGAANSGVSDVAGNLLAANTSDAWLVVASSVLNTSFISPGAVWKYLANGTNQGTAWRANTFNESAWPSGPAQLGYGDGDEATVVSYGPDPNNKYITTYFRKTFDVPNAAAVTTLTLRLLRDDGAVVYLNGVEVFRDNMPAGTINFETEASSALGVPQESTFIQASLNPASLVTGTNLIAVEIHQDNPGSSDISFDLALLASVTNTTTQPSSTQQAKAVLVGNVALMSLTSSPSGFAPVAFAGQNQSQMPYLNVVADERRWNGFFVF